MKKLLFTAGLALAMTTQVDAQSKNTRSNVQYLSLGPIAGVGHSWISSMDHQDLKPSVSLGIGLVYSKHEHWGWGADLVASHEGFKVKDEATGTKMAINPTYLRLTPKAYYFFGKYGSPIRPKVYAGPSLGVKLKEDHYNNGDRMSAGEPAPVFNREDVFNDLDLGLTAGAGLNIRLAKSTWLSMDGNYYHGLLDVTDHGNMNRNLRFNIGVMFGL